MKKIKYIIILFFLWSFTIVNNVFAINENIITQDWYFFENNWVYYWKKKLDETKLQSLVDSYNYSNLAYWFNNDQQTLISNLNWNNYYRYYMYKSMYYDIKINNISNVLKIENSSWEELSFNNENISWINNIKLYYNSFFNEKIATYNWETNDYILKNENNYINTANKIKVFLVSWEIIEFDFKFYLPELNFSNTLVNKNWYNMIILDSNNQIVLNWNQIDSSSISINSDNGLINQYNENNITTSLEYLNYNTPYIISFINNYDLFYKNYSIFNNNSCSSSWSIEFSKNWNWTSFYIYMNDNQDSAIFTDITYSIKKYNDQNWNFEEYTNFTSEFNWWNEVFIYPEDNWLYKIIPNVNTMDDYLCNTYYNKDKNYWIISSIYNNNSIYFFEDWYFWTYWTIEKVFPYLNQEINFDTSWEYSNFLDKIEKFDFKITDENQNIINEWDNSCLLDWNCTNNVTESINSYLSMNPDSRVLNLDIVYKDIYSLEKTFTKQYNYPKTPENYIEEFYYWDNFIWLYTHWFNNETIEQIKISDISWANNELIELTEAELNNLNNEVNLYINENGLSYDNYYDYFDEKLFELKWYNYIYNYNGYTLTLFSPRDKIKDLDKLIINSDLEIDLKTQIWKFIHNNFDLEKVWNLYTYINSWIIIDINSINNLEIIDKNNLIIQNEKINPEYINNYWSYYEMIESDETLYEIYQNKIIYEIVWEKILLIVPNSVFNNIKEIRLKNDINLIQKIDSFAQFWEIINFNDTTKIWLVNKESDYWYFSVNHYFMTPIENTLFIRKINLYKNAKNWFLKVDLNLTWTNITTKNLDKLYICTNYIDNIENIDNTLWCFNYDYINNFWLFIENINTVYIYWVKWIVNNDFKTIKIDFEIKYDEIIFEA